MTMNDKEKELQQELQRLRKEADVKRNLKEQKEEATLRSPIDGVVSNIADIRTGDSVNPEQKSFKDKIKDLFT